MNDNTFPQWFNEKLKAADFTVIKLAYETGLSRTSIYNYLTGINTPSKITLEKLCASINADAEEGFQTYTPKKLGRPFGGKKYGDEHSGEEINKIFKRESVAESMTSAETSEVVA